MDVCQALTGHGGWPLTVIMTPDQKPFFAGTYFPKEDRMGIRGLISILNAVKSAWKTNRNDLISSGEKITEYISAKQVSSKREIPEDIFDRAFSYFKKYFDDIYGGFGSAPKFPAPHNLMFLLRYWKVTGNEQALQMVEKTLDSMYKGGIYDHIGYGFSRYSTDRKWLVPHFEKMLYDNALLAIAYLEAFQATKKNKYAFIARDILTYVLRDMTSSEGGFFSAEDADSEGVEGKFYLWTLSEIYEVLGEEQGRKFASFYNITSKGNFEGKNIPNLINNNLPFEETEALKPLREKLFQYRKQRIHPHKDDKILTSWNGLMIAAMAMAGRLLNEESFTNAAQKAVDFLYKNLFNKDRRLLARYREGESAYLGYAEDYSFLTFGLIELYETTLKSDYLEKALSLSEKFLSLFWDEEDGGFYVYGNDGEKLISRPKEIYDGAMPSSNSVAALNFIRLSRLTGKQELETKAHDIFKAFSDEITLNPMSHAYSLIALMFAYTGGKEIVIAADDFDNAKPFIEEVSLNFHPFTVWLLKKPDDHVIDKISPFTETYKMKEGKTTAYVCERFACKAPVTDINEFKKLVYS